MRYPIGFPRLEYEAPHLADKLNFKSFSVVLCRDFFFLQGVLKGDAYQQFYESIKVPTWVERSWKWRFMGGEEGEGSRLGFLLTWLKGGEKMVQK